MYHIVQLKIGMEGYSALHAQYRQRSESLEISSQPNPITAMALKIALKPREKMIIDGAVITNGSSRCELYIENNVPILRQKDILTEEEADSPALRIYFTIQLMYIDEENLALYHKNYWKLVKDFIQAAPTVLPIIDQINDHILNGHYYRALKLAKNIISYEREAIQHAVETASGVPNG